MAAKKVFIEKKYRDSPVMYQLPNKKWVGIGGSFSIKRKAPKKPRRIPEATKAEYMKFIFNDGRNKIFGYVQNS